MFAQVLESAAEGKASDQAGVDVPAVLAAYNARRLEDALAVVKLSAQRMGGYRLPSIRFVGTMMVTMGLHKTLGRLAPKVCTSYCRFRPPFVSPPRPSYNM